MIASIPLLAVCTLLVMFPIQHRNKILYLWLATPTGVEFLFASDEKPFNFHLVRIALGPY